MNTPPGPAIDIAAVAGAGFAAQVFQVLALREVLGQVEGSEAAIGAALAAWLLGGAAGTLAGRRAAARAADPRRLLALAAPAAAVLAAAAILAVRFARALLPLAPGEPPGVGAGLAVAAAGGFLPAVGWGFAFPAAAALLGGRRAFAVEAAGALAGGLLFTFVLAPWMPPAGIAALLLLVAAAPLSRSSPGIAVPALLLGAAGVLAGPALERASREAAWESWLPGHRLLATAQSRRGPLDVIGLRGQASLYRYGHLDFTSPDPEGAALKAHLALCLHPFPRTVLLAGGGPAVLREMLLQPVDRIVVAEPDPEVLASIEPFLAPEDRAALRDPRVTVLGEDPRAALREAADRYDVVALFGLEPSTAAANRFYTQEFFGEAERALAPDGILILSLRGTGEYQAPDLLRRNAKIRNSAMGASMWARMVPGESGYLVARPLGPVDALSGDIELDPAVLAQRFRDRGIRTAGMTPEHFHLLFPRGEAERLEETLRVEGSGAGWNSDREPAVVQETFLLRAAEQGSFLRILQGGSAPWAVAGAVLLVVVALAVFGRPTDASVAGTGFAGMGVAVAVLLGYQSSRGDLYAEVGLLAGIFMAGIALGSLSSSMCLRLLEVLVLTSVICVQEAWRGPWTSFLLALFVGIFTGATFPAALAAGGDAARLYALDLAGSAAGALLVGTVFLPATGTHGVMALLAAVKVVGAVTAWVREPRTAPASPG